MTDLIRGRGALALVLSFAVFFSLRVPTPPASASALVHPSRPSIGLTSRSSATPPFGPRGAADAPSAPVAPAAESYANAAYVSWSQAEDKGLHLAAASDGTGACASQGGRIAYRVSSNGYLYFNVDDTYLYNGASGTTTYDSAEVTVTYFDSGYGRFYLTYHSSQDNTSIAADPRYTPSFSNDLQTNDVVYLTDSGRWLTYTFTLDNVKFANGEYGPSDFRLVQAQDASTPSDSYLLTVDAITVTRKSKSEHVDRKGRVQGNNGRAGDPLVVWTRLASKNDGGHGLYQVEDVVDGGTTVSATGANQGRQATSGYIYFDVNDNYIYDGNARIVHLTVEYKDSGGPFTIQYESTTNLYQTAETVTPGNTGAFKRYTFSLEDARFANGQNGGADFRIVSNSKDLVVRNVGVFRAPGPYVAPRNSSLSYSTTVDSRTRQVAAFYFPVFDGYYSSLWEASTMGPPGADPSTHVLKTYSYRSLDTLGADLLDMQNAGVDVVLPWYQGGTSDAAFLGVQAIQNLVRAHDAVASSIKIGLFLDPVHLYGDAVMKAGSTPIDLRNANAAGMLFKLAEDFYSLIPPSKAATINGRPLVVLYSPAAAVTNPDALDLTAFKARFKRSFGVEPYIVADINWDSTTASNSELRAGLDDWFGWSAALVPPGYSGFWGNTAVVGAGFDDSAAAKKYGGTPRQRDRANGAVYDFAWQQTLNRRPHLVFLETWNYWVEGSGVARSDLYGDLYYNKTKQYVAAYKGTSYAGVSTVTADLGTGEFKGVAPETKVNYAENVGTSTYTVGSWAGRTAARLDGDALFFVLDDTFAFDVPSGSGSFQVDITYWDGEYAAGGADQFVLKWDGQTNKVSPVTDSIDSNIVAIRYGAGHNTKQWRTDTIVIQDAKLANRFLTRYDLFIGGAKGLWIQKISVTKPAGLVKATNGPGEVPQQASAVAASQRTGSTAFLAPDRGRATGSGAGGLTSGTPITPLATAPSSSVAEGPANAAAATASVRASGRVGILALCNLNNKVSLPAVMASFSSASW